jgi:glycosyltransferase involved in cell wall biosynthesis
MTDPLGQSQVIPYLIGLSKAGYQITLLSCEKRDKFKLLGVYIQELLDKHHIEWSYVFFTASPPILAKYYDLFQLRSRAIQLYQSRKFSLVHCRSYVAANIGLVLKQKFGLQFIFDIRGFWVDERVDGGLWNLKNPIYKIAYNLYKKKEASYITHADAIVSLTDKGKIEMQTWKSYGNTQIDVIPCCADYNLFSLKSDLDNSSIKISLGFDKDDFVLSYLGSIGTWYMLDEMLDFFKILKKLRQNSKFLFVSNGDNQTIISAAIRKGIDVNDIKVVNAKRAEVPQYIKVSSLSLSFIKPCYSKISSSPTKLGELLAIGIPVVCNTAIGDVEEIINYTKGGFMIHEFTTEEYKKVIHALERYFAQYNPSQIRELSRKYYDLSNGIEKYTKLYNQVLN